MKKTHQLLAITMFIGITVTSFSNGQNVNTPNPGGGQVINRLTKWTNIGVTNFSINNSQITDNGTNVDIATPSIGLGAVLNVHGFDANTGNVFSTNCPATIESKWSIYKGGSFIGYINSAGTHLGITASKSILFATQNITSWTRMFLYENGNVGIGHWGFIPQSPLHLFELDAIPTYIQFTNEYAHSLLSPTPYDGFKIGITWNSVTNQDEAELHQYENAPMTFFTGDYQASNHAERMRIMPSGLVGINTTIPTNTLEINQGSTDYSGLTFSQLTSASTANILTSYGKVLTVNSTGDVVLTTDDIATADNGLTINPTSSGNVQLGGVVGSGTGQLIQHTEIPMNDFNLIFSDNSSWGGPVDAYSNSIGIGTAMPYAKLHVNRTPCTPPGSAVGIWVDNSDVSDPGAFGTISVGIYNVTNGKNDYNYGITSDVFNAKQVNVAGSFYAIQATQRVNIGGTFAAQLAPYNYAVIGEAPTYNLGSTQFNVGIYGYAPQVAIPAVVIPWTGSWAGYFNGDVASMSYNFIPSDSTIKTNIKQFNSAGSILKKINCYTYNYDSTKYGDHVSLPKTKQYGFLAQEIAKADSSLVKNGCLPPKLDSLRNVLIKPQPVLMIDYPRFVPLLLGGYKEQQAIIDSLNGRLTLLETLVANCCSQPKRNANPETSGENERTKIKLENSTACILYQNQPNPYSTSTVIRFFIPENMNDVKIIFQDNTGKILKEVELKQTGQSSLEVDGSELSTGIYTYSLVVKGKIIDTKKMMKQ